MFKVGDVVRCVNAKGSCGGLYEGIIYVVATAQDGKVAFHPNLDAEWDFSRFEALDPPASAEFTSGARWDRAQEILQKPREGLSEIVAQVKADARPCDKVPTEYVPPKRLVSSTRGPLDPVTREPLAPESFARQEHVHWPEPVRGHGYDVALPVDPHASTCILPDPTPAAEAQAALRFNEGKPELWYLSTFPDALRAVADVCTKGGRKYAVGNYINGAPFSENISAAQRHLLKFWNGEDMDTDNPEHGPATRHLAHAIWNLMRMLQESITPGPGTKDDRVFYARKLKP